jgi:hypothetical protein
MTSRVIFSLFSWIILFTIYEIRQIEILGLWYFLLYLLCPGRHNPDIEGKLKWNYLFHSWLSLQRLFTNWD